MLAAVVPAETMPCEPTYRAPPVRVRAELPALLTPPYPNVIFWTWAVPALTTNSALPA